MQPKIDYLIRLFDLQNAMINNYRDVNENLLAKLQEKDKTESM